MNPHQMKFIAFAMCQRRIVMLIQGISFILFVCVVLGTRVGAVETTTGDDLRPVKQGGVMGGRLWDQEPALWDAAHQYQIVRKLPAAFGWEGPRGAFGGCVAIANAGPRFGGPGGEDGVNISNERLETAFWGKPDRLVFSLAKTDVFDRANQSDHIGKKPVGQILLLAEDFAGADQPSVSTSIHNGDNALHLSNGKATADLQTLITDSETNVIAIKVVYTNLGKPVAVRLYRHKDTLNTMAEPLPNHWHSANATLNAMPEPQSGNDGTYFWIRQTFTKDKTFPQGFDYCLVAKIAGAKAAMQNADMLPNLGATVPYRKPDAPGSAATAQLPLAVNLSMVIYATVVTRAEADDTLAEAKKRLAAAEALGYDGLLARNEQWYRTLYTQRERGRIFTGNIDDAKQVTLPYLYQSRRHSWHTYNSDPDPTRYESDANYNIIECDDVSWSGLTCFNEELYTGAFVVGRDETAANYYTRLFNFWRPAWEKYTASQGHAGLYILRGYVPPLKNEVYWTSDGGIMNGWNGCDWASMVWAFKSVWDAWDYGAHDLAYLREQVYPSLRGIADFFASILKPGDDGRYHLERSQIREEDVGRDAIDCIASAKWSFRHAIEAASLLGVDAGKCALWKERLDKVAPYYVINNDREPILASLVVNGKPVVAGHGTTHFVVNVADEINLESSEQDRKMAIRSNWRDHNQPMNRQVEYLLGDSPDMLVGSPDYNWIHLFGHSPWLMFYAQKSGAGEFARTGPLKTQAQKTIACWLEPERLCNSRSGTIVFFPCTPSDFDVAFKDFQARGGFLVSGELRGGAVTYASVISRRGGVCAVRNPWPGKELYIYEQSAQTPVSTTKTSEKHTFPTIAGKTYALSPIPLNRIK